jgi:hypothetical protein
MMLFAPISLFAQTLDLQTSTNMADINSSFSATISVSWIQWGDVSIGWIENFEVINQSRSQSMQIINGRQSTQVQLVLNLQPKEVGTFTLGPARVDTPQWAITSQSVIIEVDGESLFGNSSAILNDEEPSATEPLIHSYNWIGWLFGLLVIWLIIRVFKVARKKQSVMLEESNSSWYQTSQTFSWGHMFEWTLQELIRYARTSVDVQWNLSITELIRHTQDGELAWLLKRIEQQTYSDTPDPLLEDDCMQYLQEVWVWSS